MPPDAPKSKSSLKSAFIATLRRLIMKIIDMTVVMDTV
jgi:hypothetical protein